MSTVRLNDRVLHMGEHTKAFDQAFSAIQVNAELFDFEHNLLRFGRKIELEVLHRKSEQFQNDKVLCFLRVQFNEENVVQLLSVHTDEDDVHWTTDFEKVIEVLIKIGQQMIQGDAV